MPARRSHTIRRLLWGLAAAGLWFGAALFELSTPVEIFSDGGRIQVTVATSTVTAPVGISSLQEIELEVMDSIEPPGGRFIELEADGEVVFRDSLPRRFALPHGAVQPIGDWEIDELAAEAVVYTRAVEHRGPFTLRTELTGRYLHVATLRLGGTPSFAVALRRGLINNDMFILDGEGRTIAATSIDPQPAASTAAILATVMRSLAAACVVILAASLLRRPVAVLCPSRWGTLAQPSPAPALQWLVVAFTAVAAVAVSAWVAVDVLGALPHQPDSVTYTVQAEWFADGALSMPIPKAPDHFDLPFLHSADGRWISHYPPGWPTLLAVGVAVGAPWLVAPLLSALFTVLLFLTGRELFTPGVGLAAAILGFISPFATILFASRLSHGAAATAILLATWLILLGLRTGHRWQALAGGLSLGVAFAIRPLTAVAVAFVFVLLLADRGSRARRDIHGISMSFAVGGVLATLPTMAANYALTGSLFRFPYTMAEGTMFGWRNLPFGLVNLDAILATTPPALFGWEWGIIAGRAALAIPLAFALIPLIARRPGRRVLFLVGLYLAVLVAHLGAQASGLHGFGPRYHFEVFAVLYLLTARGFQLLARRISTPQDPGRNRHASMAGSAAVAVLLAVLCGSATFKLPRRMELYRGYNQVSGCLAEQIEARSLRHGLVLFTTDDWQNWAEVSEFMDGGLEGELIFATLREDNQELLELYGDRQVFLWDGTELREGTREEILNSEF